ncbi:hypothetical protein COOONC_14069, partial [Cooperia oncophora]
MISALRFFRATIYGNLTRIFSDHKPLTFLLKHKKMHDNLARWIVELQSYNITIEYLKGSSNTVADCLSRISLASSQFRENSPESDDIVEFPRCLAGVPLSASEPLLHHSPIAIRPHDLVIEQQQDRFCRDIVHFLKNGTFPEDVDDSRKASLLQIAERARSHLSAYFYARFTALYFRDQFLFFQAAAPPVGDNFPKVAFMDDNPSGNSPRSETGTGVRPTSPSSGHTLADSTVLLPADDDRDSMEVDTLLRTLKQCPSTADPDVSRGSSLLAESPRNAADLSP